MSDEGSETTCFEDDNVTESSERRPQQRVSISNDASPTSSAADNRHHSFQQRQLSAITESPASTAHREAVSRNSTNHSSTAQREVISNTSANCNPTAKREAVSNTSTNRNFTAQREVVSNTSTNRNPTAEKEAVSRNSTNRNSTTQREIVSSTSANRSSTAHKEAVPRNSINRKSKRDERHKRESSSDHLETRVAEEVPSTGGSDVPPVADEEHRTQSPDELADAPEANNEEPSEGIEWSADKETKLDDKLLLEEVAELTNSSITKKTNMRTKRCTSIPRDENRDCAVSMSSEHTGHDDQLSTDDKGHHRGDFGETPDEGNHSRRRRSKSHNANALRAGRSCGDLHEGSGNKHGNSRQRTSDNRGCKKINKSSSLVDLHRRPNSNLVDLHVYLIPREKWSSSRRLADRNSRTDTISLGFVRVPPDMFLFNIRRDISEQLLGDNLALVDYRFARPVGKHFAEVKPSQESRLKARNFMPPYTSDPELHLRRTVTDHDDAEQHARLRQLDRMHRIEHDYSLTRAALNDLRERYNKVKQIRERQDKAKEKLLATSKKLQEDLNRRKEEDCEKWQKVYQNERRLTVSLEESCATLRHDVDQNHNKLVQRVRTRNRGTSKEAPSRKLTLKMNIQRTEAEICDWERRRQTAQMVLNTEIMLRSQAERHVKELRKELSQKSLSVSQLRSQYGQDAVELQLLLGRARTGRAGRNC